MATQRPASAQTFDRERPGRSQERRRPWFEAAVLGLAVTLGVECLRMLFPLAFSYRERAGIASAVLVLLAVFVTPALAVPLTRWLHPGRAVLLTSALLGVARVAVQGMSTVPIGLAAVASALGLLAIATAWNAAPLDASTRVLAVVAGLALDTIVRGAWLTWDLPWHHDPLAGSAAALLVALLLLCAWLGRDTNEEPTSRAAALLALGPFLALQIGFLQSPAFAASSGGTSLTTAVAVVLLGDVIALGKLAGAPRPRPASIAAVLGLGLVLAVGAWWITSLTGSALLVLLIALQLVAVVLLATGGAGPPARPSAAVAVGATTIGALALGAVLLLYQLHYDRPLPFSNRWVPVAAAAILAAAALPAAITARAKPVSAPAPQIGRMSRRAGTVVVAGAAVVSLILVSGLTVTEPTTAGARSRDELRVVTYNPHEAVTRDGQLDPEAMAAAVEPTHPDVLVLVEAGRGWSLSSEMDLAEWAKRRLGLGYAWAPAADHQFGNLVFSRLPLHDTRVVALPQGSGTMRRSALITRVGPVGGRSVTVIGVHFQNGSSRASHATRVSEVDALVRSWHHTPRTVLLGDLNSDPGSPELGRLLGAGFTTTQDTQHCTMPTSNRNCSDWILVTNDLVQQPVRALPVDTFDHRPVVSTVRPR